ncbi:MAG: ABC transporter substrate-binding protein [Firmicutes bacterium]|nr:ABC transporter substrate-binding protein [Bacillota bacterium]
MKVMNNSLRGAIWKALLYAAVLALFIPFPTQASSYKEAPALSQLVNQGKLPPVDKRLPEKPMIIKPLEKVGEYGGTLRMGTIVANSIHGPHVIFMGEGILRFDSDYKSIIPNVAESYNLSKDGKILTIKLRKGIKWSDGVPFTADDILFWWEDIALNTELSPAGPDRRAWCPGGKPMKLKKIDDYTIELQFEVSHPLILNRLAHGYGMGMVDYPKHYLKQFHPKYTSMDKIKKMVKESKAFDYWYQLFWDKARMNFGVAMNPECPSLEAFVLKHQEPGRLVFDRNPYYWKTDTAGNQLPYIDRIEIKKASDITAVNSWIITGQVDFDGFHTTLQRLATYKQSEGKGDYRILLYKGTFGTEVLIQFNQTIGDPVLRKIFQDLRFRKAMSLAINRDEINKVLYHGLGEPRNATVLPICNAYEEAFAKAYAQYDPKEANRLLDEMGLNKKDASGFRLRPDGKRLSLIIEYCESDTPKTPTLELVKEYWNAVGVQTDLKLISNTLESQRAMANQIQVGIHHADRSTDPLFFHEPFWYAPINHGWEQNTWVLWAQWYVTGGKAGEKPPEHVMKLIDAYDKMQRTTNERERIELAKFLLKQQAENLWVLGTVGNAPYVLIVKNNLRNVPEKGYWGWDGYFGYPYYPEQFYFETSR